MEKYISQEARKYLKRMPQLVLDQINKMGQRMQQLEQDNQYLQQELQQMQKGQGQYPPMGFQQPEAHFGRGFGYGYGWPYRQYWGYPYFAAGQGRGQNQNDPDDRRGFDTPYMEYRRQYQPTRSPDGSENPRVTNDGNQRQFNPDQIT